MTQGKQSSQRELYDTRACSVTRSAEEIGAAPLPLGGGEGAGGRALGGNERLVFCCTVRSNTGRTLFDGATSDTLI